MTFSVAALIVPLLLFSTAQALWPFKEKRFKDEAFINAGSLGLDKVEGRVVAFGDWNGDSKLDLFTLSKSGKTVQVHLWNKDKFQYIPSHTLSVSSQILNVVSGDYNHDGILDLLIMSDNSEDEGWWGKKKERLGMQVYLGGGEFGGFQASPWTMPLSKSAQPLVFDADGSLRPSLLGHHPTEGSDGAVTWLNNGTGFSLQTPPLKPINQLCTLKNPHSSAYIDIDGDCLPDLVLHCSTLQSQDSLQIWLNRGEAGYILARSYTLPSGAGPLSFADINRDGSIDIVFPTCSRRSESSGLGSNCNINIVYNKQASLCSTETSQWNQDELLKCRGWGDMCISDEKFEFSFDADDPGFVSIPLASLTSDSDARILLHVPSTPSIPLPLTPGDFNLDGFPDLLFIISLSGSTTVKVLESVLCTKGVVGCAKNTKRGWRFGGGNGWRGLNEIRDAVTASWLDFDEDGSLDILVQRTGKQSGEKVTFIKNGFYHDAFFLRTQVLNGVCDGKCEPTLGGKTYNPLGVNYAGASFKFTLLDTAGRRVAQQVTQLAQSGYHSLQMPYAFFGLGRTNNYVEKLFVGASLFPPNHVTVLESLIPNSQVIINPPYPASLRPDENKENSSVSPVKLRSTEWKSRLYLKPGDWVPWVGAVVLGTVIVLGTVVIGLYEKEKREDERERQRALHAINFQAL
ncbi:uncharacterized protein L203_103454 [Cryptococcus depauperatus CBS 7841]|uniref:T-cell immunomodulatory protein TIP C2 domain-containing protein n=1 Tax=Cryptococcus depauperatus CBS 7841 TaxID=1295531 RepID=A0AAJ8JTQ2_9TREE